MESSLSARERQQLDIELLAITKWYEDAAFRQAVRLDPRRALREHLGVQLADGVAIHIHEETRQNVPIAISRVTSQRTDLTEWQKRLSELYIQGLHGHRYRPLLEASVRDQRARERLAAELGVAIPPEVTLTVYEETEREVHICAPNPCQKEEDSGLDLSRNPRDFWILTLLDLISLAHAPKAQ